MVLHINQIIEQWVTLNNASDYQANGLLCL